MGKQIDIDTIKRYLNNDKVFLTAHVNARMEERDIRISEVYKAIMNGEIIEQYEDDTPFPSCLIMGKADQDKVLHVVVSDEEEGSHVITTYRPNPDKWSEDFKTRREQ